jgi:hypothetical protein
MTVQIQQFKIRTRSRKKTYGDDKGKILEYFVTPCLKEFPEIGYDRLAKNMRTITKDIVIREHCNDCIVCKTIIGKSKRKHFAQDDVAILFGVGIDDKSSPSGNFSSENGILTHYSTIEAIRANDGKIISNRQCWSRGFAKCSLPKNVYMSMDLTALIESLFVPETHIKEISIVDKDKNGNVLFKYNDKYFINGVDSGNANRYNRTRYISELRGKPQSLKEAYEDLKPIDVKNAERYEQKVERQGELFFIKSQIQITYSNVQKRVKIPCVFVQHKCKVCGVKGDITKVDIDIGKEKLDDLKKAVNNRLVNLETEHQDEKDREIWKRELTRGLNEINNKVPTGDKLIMDRINDDDCKVHPSFYGWYERVLENLKEMEKIHKEKKCTSDDMERTERIGYRFSDYPDIFENNSHTVTEVAKFGDSVYVRGIVRHKDHDHPQLNLGKGWYLVLKNTQVRGMSVSRLKAD